MTWSKPFEDEIATPAGKRLVTLKDAADHIRKLPKKDQQAPHWQLAIETLIMAAENRGPVLHAEIAMRRALNHGRPDDPVKPPRRKAAKKFRLIK
jgi:hypothetical protein